MIVMILMRVVNLAISVGLEPIHSFLPAQSQPARACAHMHASTVGQQHQSHKSASTASPATPSIVFGKGSGVQTPGGGGENGSRAFEDPILGAFASMHFDQHHRGAVRASTGSYKAPAYTLYKSAPSTSEGIAGVGVMLKKMRDDIEEGEESVQIVGLVEGGAADRSGVVRTGDVVLSVDGWAVKAGNSSVTCKDVMLRLTGPPHTPVVLTLVRPASGETFRVFLTRGAANSSLGENRRKDRASLSSAIPAQRKESEKFPAVQGPIIRKSHANLYVDELFASTKALIRCVYDMHFIFPPAHMCLRAYTQVLRHSYIGW
jgi:hypothetical protein